MRTLTVNTPSHAYPIFIGHDVYQQPQQTLAPYIGKRVAIISNQTVAPLYLPRLQAVLDALGCAHFSIILPDGEAHKNGQTLNLIYDGLMQHRAERNTTLIALGGGVIGDMVGFAAATYQRGAPFVQIPTTLLSQVDSSVGGKTAINHPLGKNMIGAFYQPQAVLVDLGSLQTLPPRSSMGVPSTSMMRPSVALPTGTVMGLPVLVTMMPRRRPSEEPSAMVRTMPSPSCCCTSSVSAVPSSLRAS